MNDLDTLRPEVRDAVHRTDVTVEMLDTLVTVDRDDYDTMRSELLRLTDDCARLVDCINAQPPTRRSLIDRAERAETELAALKARIAEAPVAHVRAVNDSMGGITRTYVFREGQASVALPTLDGKRVRLVVED